MTLRKYLKSTLSKKGLLPLNKMAQDLVPKIKQVENHNKYIEDKLK
jgi:hypothetical protein